MPSPLQYYELHLLVGVPKENLDDWGSQCDEIFHGPAGRFHDPENHVWVAHYNRTTEPWADLLKYKLFTEEGGI